MPLAVSASLDCPSIESRPCRLNTCHSAAGASTTVTATTLLPTPGTSESKQELGQFFTPEAVAEFMASLFECSTDEIQLLDAGAGEGALTEAFVRMACSRRQKPSRLTVVAYEVDVRVLDGLRQTMERCQLECAARGIEFDNEIRHADFIESALEFVRDDLFNSAKASFNAALLNPPYRKINSDSRTRRLLREAGIETSNLYTAFLALASRLLCDGGEMVSITPRSFCNGPYFRPFRREFLGSMSLERLHVFDSRSAAFQRDSVLQENLIVRAVKSRRHTAEVVISSSSGEPGANIQEIRRPYADVVRPDDAEQFIHIMLDESQATARDRVRRFTSSLVDLGLQVSTGRVVDFRAKQHLRLDSVAGTVPLIYPCHFEAGFVRWPKSPSKKPNAIADVRDTTELLVSNQTYVLVKRFSAKEERRRVVASVFDPKRIACERVGFENHLNYFHADGAGLEPSLARGLAAYLNSTAVDQYFRQFNGHTQVNATDLRSLPYPSAAELRRLGSKIADRFPEQTELDQLLESELE